jgi:hypothetical protein
LTTEKILVFSFQHLSLRQFFTITYQERQREMALRSLSNQPPVHGEQGATSTPVHTGKDKSALSLL